MAEPVCVSGPTHAVSASRTTAAPRARSLTFGWLASGEPQIKEETMIGSKQIAALLVSLISLVTMGVTANSASAISYWDGRGTQVDVQCGADFGWSSLTASSATNVPAGYSFYWVDLYNGNTLMVRSNRWIPAGQSFQFYSAAARNMWATHFRITHARWYNGQYYQFTETKSYFFSYGGAVEDCLF
jgi:hypothetical protein